MPVKHPLNLHSLTWSDLRLLSVYLHLKGMAESGTLTKSQIRSVWYWREKLVNRGLIKLDNSGDYYLIRGYAPAFRIFGIEKTLSKNKLFNRVFCKRLEKETSKEILQALFQHKADSLGEKIRYARNAGRQKKSFKIEAPLSAKTVSRLFGYSQACTGSRKRKLLFDVVNEPLRRVMVYIPEINTNRLVSRYATRRVMI
jgi:hypothetical protein